MNEKGKVFFKVESHYKNFPLNVKINRQKGAFDAFVSQNTSSPNTQNYDFYFSSDTYSIIYTENIPVVYLGIYATQYCKMTISVSFKKLGAKEDAKKSKYVPLKEIQLKNDKAKSKKNRIYKYYSDNMTRE
jgi:hypothetical protein